MEEFFNEYISSLLNYVYDGWSESKERENFKQLVSEFQGYKGLGETAQTLVRVASSEHEQKGAVGAVGGVLRQIPPTVVAPFIVASAATSNLLGGVRSQLVPDARREATLKWRSQDN